MGVASAALWILAVRLYAAEPRAPGRPAYPWVSVREFGALGDGVTDDTEAMQRALDQARHRCIYFPPGLYLQAHFVNLRASESCLVAAPGTVLSNRHPGTSGYQNDGIRIGDASPRDGGTGHATNIRDVYISGFQFDGEGRIGIWVVYAERVTVENISGAGQAVVAAGNDNDDECRDVVLRGIHRTGPTAADWYTAAVFSTRNFVMENVTSLYAVGSQAIAVTNSRYGTLRDVEVDQRDGAHDGIALLDSRHIRVERFRIRHARKGLVLYSAYVRRDAAYLEQRNEIGPGTISDSRIGLHIYSRFNIVSGIDCTNVDTRVLLSTDARENRISP